MDMSDTDALLANLHGSLRQDEPMARHVSWRAGGVAKVFYQPASVPDLCAFLRTRPAGEPILFLGLGSNLLVRDGGFDGAVVFTHHALTGIRQEGGSQLRPTFHVGAGVPAPHLARYVAKHGGAGSEWMCGVPGTIGGALAMNAGCYGGETWRFVARVEVLTRAGILEERTPLAYAIGYRSVRVAGGGARDGLFTAAWFAFPEGDASAARTRIAELLRRRMATQPLNLPNAGSVFRNPAGDHAARLIEICGLKGYAVGGARVSEKHANFIVNPQGAAKAADIEAIIAHVRAVVRERTGIDLEPEVQVMGVEASP